MRLESINVGGMPNKTVYGGKYSIAVFAGGFTGIGSISGEYRLLRKNH